MSFQTDNFGRWQNKPTRQCAITLNTHVSINRAGSLKTLAVSLRLSSCWDTVAAVIFFAANSNLTHITLLLKYSELLKVGTSCYQFLGAFAKLQRATISFVIFFCASTCNSAPTRRIFKKFNIWISLKSFEKIQVSLKSDEHNFKRRHTYIYHNVNEFLLEWKIFQT